MTTNATCYDGNRNVCRWEIYLEGIAKQAKENPLPASRNLPAGETINHKNSSLLCFLNVWS